MKAKDPPILVLPFVKPIEKEEVKLDKINEEDVRSKNSRDDEEMYDCEGKSGG